MTHAYTSTQMAKILKILTAPHIDKQLEFSYITGGNKNGTITLGNS